jgi:hypothetical protein
MDIQRLRNLTTKKIHTNHLDMHQDIEIISRYYIFDHQTYAALDAIQSFLMKNITDDKFFENKVDKSHNGCYDIPSMNDEERQEFLNLLKERE